MLYIISIMERHTEDDFSKIEQENAALVAKLASLSKSATNDNDIVTSSSEPEMPKTDELPPAKIKALSAAIDDINEKTEKYDEMQSTVDEESEKIKDLQSKVEDLTETQGKLQASLQAFEDAKEKKNEGEIDEMANKIAEQDIISGKINFEDKANHINTLKTQTASQLQAIMGYALHAATNVSRQANTVPKFVMPAEDIKPTMDSIANRRARLFTGSGV